MADDGTVKTLVAKLVLDVSDFTTKTEQIKASMGSVAEQAKSVVAQDQASTEKALAAAFKELEQQKALGVAKQEAAKASAAVADSEIAGTAKVKAAKAEASTAAVAGSEKEKAAKESVYSTELAWLQRIIAAGKSYSAILSEQLVKSGIIRQGAEASGTGLSVAGIARVTQIAATPVQGATTVGSAASAVAQGAAQTALAEKTVAAKEAELTWTQRLIAAAKEYSAILSGQLVKHEAVAGEIKKEAKESEGLSALGIAKGFTQAGVKGATGGGIIGSTLTGLISGAGLTLGIEAAYEGFEKLTEKMKEFIEDSGGLQKVTEQFGALSRGSKDKGADPTEFLEKLRSATHDLVPDIDLLRAANTFMQSSLKLSNEDMLKLTAATVGLARAQGHDAADAVKALNQSFLSGRSQQLAQITGIQSQLLQVRGMGETLSRVAQTNISFAQTVKLIEERYSEIGQPLLTYTDRIHQLQNVQKQLFEGVAQGVVTSKGFTAFMELLGQAIDNLGGMEEAAKKFGAAIGDAFVVIAPFVMQIKGLFEDAKKSIDSVSHSIETFSLIGTKTKSKGAPEDLEAYNTQGIQDQFEKIHPVLSLMIKLFATLGATIRETAADFGYLVDELAAVGTALSQASETSRKDITEGFSKGNIGQLFKGLASSTGIGTFGTIRTAASPITKAYQDQLRQIKKEKEDSITIAETTLQTATAGVSDRTIPLPLPAPADPALARKQRLADAQAQTQKQIADAKEALDAIKDYTSEETEYEESMYKKGNETITEYYTHKNTLAAASRDAAIGFAVEEAAAKNALLDKQVQEDAKFASAAATQKAANDSQARQAIDKANSDYNKTVSKNSTAQQQDTSAANIEIINAELQTRKTALAAQVDATKAAFEQGTISAGQYLETRISQITQETNFDIEASNKRKQEEIDNSKEVAAEYAKQIASAEGALKQLQDLQNNALPQVFQKTNEQYSNALDSNQSLQQINAAGGTDITGQGTEALQRQQAALLQGQITNMESLLQQAVPYSNTWYQIYENILKATTQLQQLNNEMQNQYSLTSEVGSVFSAIGQQSKSLFTGTFGRGFASSFAGGAGVLSGTTKTQQELQADLTLPTKGKPVDPIIAAAQEAANKLATSTDTGSTALQSFTSALQLAVSKINDIISNLNNQADVLAGRASGSTNIANATDVLTNAQDTSGNLGLLQSPTLTVGVGGTNIGSGGAQTPGGPTDIFSALGKSISGVISGSDGSFGQLTKVMTTATQAIGSFAQVIAGATSPLGGALGGGQAGAGLGQSLAGSLGPAGAIIGALGGAALGAIVGQKQQNIQHDIVSIQYAVIAMNEAFSAGTASLGTTIGTLQGIIATLEQEKASSKKGSSQFQDLINQYNQQLAQLQAQQTQVIQQMTQQLASVSSPVAYQQWIQNIDQVIQQYSQFAGAAQNATQLAQANEYLTSSLQNIGQQIGDQLVQEETSAIQNALQLNQLYNQRNELELQYLNQVQQIMSQGNLTRQRTQAQSAFSQLYDVQVNYQQQLDSINQQINLAQYQLSVEQQIFNLATTKAGLESQLLTLQEQGVNEDMQRIAAMQNLLTTLQSTGYSITNLGSLSSNDPNALANQLLQDLVNELGTGQTTMIQQLEQLINVLSGAGGFGGVNPPASTPNVVPSNNPNAVTDLFTAAYQARASFGYGAYRGQNL